MFDRDLERGFVTTTLDTPVGRARTGSVRPKRFGLAWRAVAMTTLPRSRWGRTRSSAAVRGGDRSAPVAVDVPGEPWLAGISQRQNKIDRTNAMARVQRAASGATHRCAGRTFGRTLASNASRS